jgi:proteasome alpha subunit
MKPFEVEILVGQVGDTPRENELFHVLFDGSVTDQQGFVGIGGRAEDLMRHLEESYQEGWDLPTAVRAAVKALADTEEREIPADQTEAAVLDRTRSRRKFRRLPDADVDTYLTSQ